MAGTIRVLLLAADPREEGGGLRIDQEIRRALEAIRMGRASGELEIATELAVQPADLSSALLRHDPQVVHFAGHGAGERGIVLDGRERVSPEEVAALFTTFRGVRVVVLNACETLPVAEALKTVVDYTVAMETGIYDGAAVEFSGAFYAALAFGRSVPFAFDLARGGMEARYGGEHAIPRLLVRDGVEEAPLEGKAAPEAPPRGDHQVSEVAGITAKSSANIVNDSQGAAATPTTQNTHVRNSTFEGPLTIGNRRTR